MGSQGSWASIAPSFPPHFRLFSCYSLYSMMCIKWNYKGGGKLCLTGSDDILRESYAIGGHALSLFIARNGQHLRDGHIIADLFFCQLTDLREIWHAYHAIQGKYTPTSHFLILDHQYYYINMVTVLTSRCEGNYCHLKHNTEVVSSRSSKHEGRE